MPSCSRAMGAPCTTGRVAIVSLLIGFIVFYFAFLYSPQFCQIYASSDCKRVCPDLNELLALAGPHSHSQQENPNALSNPIPNQVSNHEPEPLLSSRDGQLTGWEYRAISRKRPLNVIFCFNHLTKTDGGVIFETDWIEKVLFGNVGRPIRVWNTKFNPEKGVTPTESVYMANDSVYIYLFEPSPKDLFTKMRASGYVNFGGLHMGDEGGGNDHKIYDAASFIFRNYWFNSLLGPNRERQHVYYAPLGGRNGLSLDGPFVYLPASRRHYVISFLGTNRRDRITAVDAVRKSTYASRSMIYLGNSWPDTTYHPILYRDVLHESTFTLCPYGNNEESMRFYEALEGGSIPVSRESTHKDGDYIVDGLGLFANSTPNEKCKDYRFRFCQNPIPRLKQWSEMQEFLDFYMRNPEELDLLQATVVKWWAEAKTRFQNRIRTVIDASFQKVYGDAG